MKKKLVYIGSNIPDKTPAAVRVFANALALRDYGYEVKIISKDIESDTDFNQNGGIDTWHIIRAKSIKEWINTLTSVKAYTNIIDEISDVKVVIAYELPAIAYIRLHRYCRHKGIKLICEVTEWQRWANLGYLGFVARVVRLADINMQMGYAYKKGDGIIVSSHYFADHFKGILPVLPLPTLQCHRLDVSNVEVHNRPRRFIYAGGLGYQKDMLSEIIHAFGIIQEKEYELNILGLTREQYALQYKEDLPLIDTINQDNERIIFWGEVSHTAVLEELVQSDFSLIIRQSTHRNNVGFPTKFGESINCGTPVIVSEFSDVAYYTKKYDVGILTDVNNLVGGLRRALTLDDESLRLMRQRCKECTAFYYKGHVEELGDFVGSIAADNN